jgi:hypothetical protein
MSRRIAPALAALALALVVGACSSASGTPSPSPAPGTPTAPTPVPTIAPSLDATASPDTGNVDGDWPQLGAEVLREDALLVTLVDPEARAWRIIIGGTGGAAGDRLELLVETGDVSPFVELREYRNGSLAGTLDLTGMAGNETVAAGACHATMPVCIGSDGIRLPADGDGTVLLRLDLPEAAGLSISGATAGWPGEPFTLGPWEQTEPFVWLPA